MAMLPKILRLSRNICRSGALVLAAAAFAWLAPAPLSAQANSQLVTNRLTQPIDDSARVTLQGTVHPLANAANDRGAAPDSMPLDRIQVVLKRSSAQESALKQLIADMHTPGSASYHKWLTPAQFGEQFGASDQDISTVEAWLQSKGFNVTKVNAGKQTLEMSGSVAQFRTAFNTQIHKYVVNGETHYANATDPQIPAALAPVLGGFASLNNFSPRRQSHVLGRASYEAATNKATPQWTWGNSSGVNFVLAPSDYAIQYDLSPLYSAGTNGSGQTIAIINDSNINIDLVNQFRTLFSLPANPPQVIIDGNDPGIDGINNPDGPNFDSSEAYLDVEWSGAVAPNATVDLVIGADTALASGLVMAAEHAVFGNVAPVLSISFGLGCETDLGSSNGFVSGLWEQAAAQGITAIVSAGDNGSAACDDDNQEYAVNGQAVSGLASTPYNVAVGGTDFYYSDYNNSTALTTQLATYWNPTPTQSPSSSLLQVIPEQPWNDSQYGLNAVSYYVDLTGSTATTIAAGSGGASNAAVCAAGYNSSSGACNGALSGYPKPSWQSAFGGPAAADSVRDIPDLSLFAANGQNYSFYPVCAVDGDCQAASGNNLVQITGIGGTSASAPSFAGIMALVNEKYGRQGQADFVLYPLKTQFPAAFHDVTNGTNSVPCEYLPTASPNCIKVANPITAGVQQGQIGTGTTAEYNAGAGYNLATGLGTLDANQLVTNWGNVKFTTTTTTLTASSASFTHGTAITVSGSVTPATGSATGSVALMTDSTEPLQQGQAAFPLTNGSFSSSVNYLPGGTYNIWGQYSGDSSNSASTSQKTQITVSPEPSTTYFNILDVATPSSGTVAVNPGSTISYGTQAIVAAQIYSTAYYNQCVTPTNPPASCQTLSMTTATGTVVFADGGNTINTAVLNAEGDAEFNNGWSVGSHSVTAKYSGDPSYNASSAAAIAFTVAKATPELIINSALQTGASSYNAGQPTVLHVLLENGSNAGNESTYNIGYSVPILAPTGTVTISSSPSGISGTLNLAPAVDPSTFAQDGVATLTIPASTPAGTYTLNVTYSGDSNYVAASGSTGINVAASSGLASTTTASIAGSISPNTSITVTGTVTGQSGKAAPTGSVEFFSSGYNIPTVEAALSPGSGDSSTFTAVLNSQVLSQGTNLITVQYLGNTTYAPSSTNLSSISSPLSDFSMVPETTIVPVAVGASGTDTINLSSVNGFAGAASFTCTPASPITCTITPSATLTSGSTAMLTLTINAGSSAPNGTYNVLVTGTDSTGEFVHTLGIQVAVTGSSSTASFTLTPNPATIPAITNGSSGTSTITVMPTNGFTGTVDLTCSVSGPSGATNPTCAAGPASVDISGTGSLTSTLTVNTTASTTAGAYTITVTGASSGLTENTTVAVTVNNPANAVFTLSSSAAAAVSPGSSTTSTITVGSTTGFTGTVALSCSVTSSPTGAVNAPGCSLSPTTTATTSTLTVTTSAATSSALERPLNKFFAVGGGIAVAGLLLFTIPARRRSWRSILGVLVFAAMVSLGIGCGGGSSSGGGGGSSGTTAGTYVITVTGTSGSLTASTTVSVTVN
jgi:trimeric autotransporter adhesin